MLTCFREEETRNGVGGVWECAEMVVVRGQDAEGAASAPLLALLPPRLARPTSMDEANSMQNLSELVLLNVPTPYFPFSSYLLYSRDWDSATRLSRVIRFFLVLQEL